MCFQLQKIPLQVVAKSKNEEPDIPLKPIRG